MPAPVAVVVARVVGCSSSGGSLLVLLRACVCAHLDQDRQFDDSMLLQPLFLFSFFLPQWRFWTRSSLIWSLMLLFVAVVVCSLIGCCSSVDFKFKSGFS